MNQSTVKLLKRYARLTGQNEKDVRRWWLTLDWHERTAERAKIAGELAESD